jgi:hypothetical protein
VKENIKLYELIVEQDQPNKIYIFVAYLTTIVLSLKHSPQHAQLHNLDGQKTWIIISSSTLLVIPN